MTLVDLHTHSTASDGNAAPADVVSHAVAVGLTVLGLTDHDTLDGVPAARQAANAVGLRIIAGCEFSVAVWWGEMHLLGYFLPLDNPELNDFLSEQRRRRRVRGETIVRRLNGLGVTIEVENVLHEARGAAVGRPHVARALVSAGTVPDVSTAFDRYIGKGCPAFVAKDLPDVSEVTALVARVGGVTAAAHLGRRASRSGLARLKGQGVDGVEVRHPSHDADTTAKIERLATELRLVKTGGSDWHGESPGYHRRLGEITMPVAWLDSMEAYTHERTREH